MLFTTFISYITQYGLALPPNYILSSSSSWADVLCDGPASRPLPPRYSTWYRRYTHTRTVEQTHAQYYYVQHTTTVFHSAGQTCSRECIRLRAMSTCVCVCPLYVLLTRVIRRPRVAALGKVHLEKKFGRVIALVEFSKGHNLIRFFCSRSSAFAGYGTRLFPRSVEWTSNGKFSVSVFIFFSIAFVRLFQNRKNKKHCCKTVHSFIFLRVEKLSLQFDSLNVGETRVIQWKKNYYFIIHSRIFVSIAETTIGERG